MLVGLILASSAVLAASSDRGKADAVIAGAIVSVTPFNLAASNEPRQLGCVVNVDTGLTSVPLGGVIPVRFYPGADDGACKLRRGANVEISGTLSMVRCEAGNCTGGELTIIGDRVAVVDKAL